MPSSISSYYVPSIKILLSQKRPIPPPVPPLPRLNSELSHFMAPASLISPDLDRKCPEFRLAHMRFYTELKILFPMLNKKAYYEANKSHLGVGLRWFQQWFNFEASDKEAIKAIAKPKPEKLFKQKKSARKRRVQEPPGPPPGPPPRRPRHKPKASQIASKN